MYFKDFAALICREFEQTNQTEQRVSDKRNNFFNVKFIRVYYPGETEKRKWKREKTVMLSGIIELIYQDISKSRDKKTAPHPLTPHKKTMPPGSFMSDKQTSFFNTKGTGFIMMILLL